MTINKPLAYRLADEELIGRIEPGPSINNENAALIVRRVNEGPMVDKKLAAFDAMVNAAKFALGWLEQDDPIHERIEEPDCQNCQAVKRLRAARAPARSVKESK